MFLVPPPASASLLVFCPKALGGSKARGLGPQAMHNGPWRFHDWTGQRSSQVPPPPKTIGDSSNVVPSMYIQYIYISLSLSHTFLEQESQPQAGPQEMRDLWLVSILDPQLCPAVDTKWLSHWRRNSCRPSSPSAAVGLRVLVVPLALTSLESQHATNLLSDPRPPLATSAARARRDTEGQT